MLLRAIHAEEVGKDHLRIRTDAEALAGIADFPEAAQMLRARRGYLADSPQNRAMAEKLRVRPWDFGITGSVVFGAEAGVWHPGGAPDSGLLELLGAECIDGFQRLVIIAHVAREVLAPGHLSQALIDVDIMTGPLRHRVRAEHDHSSDYCNPGTAQDCLIRDVNLRRVTAQFKADGVFFDVRRGHVAGPNAKRYTIDEATMALAFFSAAPSLALAHQMLTPEGREALWSAPSSQGYRSLFNEGTQAVGVHRAIELSRVVHEVVVGLAKVHRRRHEHLLRDAPYLVLWLIARKLPLAGLHKDQDEANCPNWREISDALADSLTEETAFQLIRAYSSARRNINRYTDLHELSEWRSVLHAAGVATR
ncbi:hypothetical protein [Streptomyces sp. NPDC048644]|uniref:hypothetical protein n=1 Tax=Streptomyces sp. NPDC048644 TaxID=3365582 RepID=UPI00371FE6AC